MEDLFDVAAEGQEPPTLPLATGGADIQVFDIAITGTREVAWRALFEGFRTLRPLHRRNSPELPARPSVPSGHCRRDSVQAWLRKPREAACTRRVVCAWNSAHSF